MVSTLMCNLLLLLLVFLPVGGLQYDFNVGREKLMIKRASTECELLESVLTQLRLLLFISEQLVFDDIEFDVFMQKAEIKGRRIGIGPLPFKRMDGCSEGFNCKCEWFAQAVAVLLRGIAVRNCFSTGGCVDYVHGYLGYTANFIAGALELLTYFQDSPTHLTGYDALKWRLCYNIDSLFCLLSALRAIKTSLPRAYFEYNQFHVEKLASERFMQHLGIYQDVHIIA